jgi:thiosulfate/3-mercaptopyruvate sulfurtransferase
MTVTTNYLTKSEILNRAEDPTLVLIDVRPLAAYNGWRLGGEKRGGHIPGAVAFPLQWLDRLNDADLEELLAAKGIARHKTIVLYGDNGADPSPLTEALRGRNFPDVLIYREGFAEWAADSSVEIESLPNFEKLVYPEWLWDRIQLRGEGGEPFVLLHVNFGVPEEYYDGHLPGALYLDTNQLEDSLNLWNRRTPEELEATLLSLGIRHDTTVILYGRDTVGDPNEKWPGRRAGQIAATRAAAILIYAGVADVRLLDGGYDLWVTAGYPLETEIRTAVPVSSFGVTIPQRPDLIVDLPEAKQILADRAGAALVSVRTWREHIGKTSGYNYIEPRGRIEGDIWGNCGSDAYHMQHYRNVDNTMRPYPEIAANWHEAGITADKWVAFYCGTGWRASETWFYAYLMGWTRIAVYDGGWFEWSKDPSNNPIEIGEPTT